MLVTTPEHAGVVGISSVTLWEKTHFFLSQQVLSDGSIVNLYSSDYFHSFIHQFKIHNKIK